MPPTACEIGFWVIRYSCRYILSSGSDYDFRNGFLDERVKPTVRPQLRIRDVAERAGVSPATVSRVLNRTAVVDELKRRDVLAAIDELGYRPNRVASNLRRQQVQMIGVVVSDIENPHFTQMVRAAEDAAFQHGYRVLLCNTDEDPDKQRSYLEVLAAERVAGAIISPTQADAPEISQLIDLGACVVSFDRAVQDKRADAIVLANASGAAQGTQHLIQGGHQRVGFVGGPHTIQTAFERQEGYEQAMAAAGLTPLVAEGDFRLAGGAAAAMELVDAGATALLVANNMMAVGVLEALRERKLKVGRDVAVISIDDPPWAKLTDPPLTTLAQPVKEMSQAAVTLLLRRLAKSRSRRKVQVFEFELRHRRSCCSGREETA
jgi:LacI family transcriptional regulator